MTIQFRGAVSGNVANATTAVVTLPAGFQTGDFCVIGGRVGNTTASFTTPAGWTIINTANNATGGYSFCFYFRVLQAGDANPTLTATVTGPWVWVSEALFSTLGTPLLFDAQGTVSNTGVTGSTFTPPAAGGGTNDASIILMVGRNSASVAPTGFTDTPAAGWTTGADTAVPLNTGANTRVAAIYYQLGVSGTVTPGTFTFTLTGVTTSLFFTSQQVLVTETLVPRQQFRLAPRRKLSRAYVQFTPVRTTNGTGVTPPSGTVQPVAAFPVPRRKPGRVVWRGLAAPPPGPLPPRQPPYLPPRRPPARAVWRGAAVPARTVLVPLQLPPIPRRRLSRAYVQFTPVRTTNGTAVAVAAVTPLQLPPVPRRKPGRAYVQFTPVRTVIPRVAISDDGDAPWHIRIRRRRT